MDNTQFTLNCPRCPAKFLETEELSLFLHIKHIHEGKGHECPTCRKGFTTKENLVYHMKIHAPQQKYICPVEDCGTGFRRKSGLSVHIKRKHMGSLGRPYQCNLCGCRYVYQDQAEIHLENKHGIKIPKPLRCPYCPRDFRKEGYRKRHMVNVHGAEPERKFQCPACEEKFIMRSTYRAHIQSGIHSKKRESGAAVSETPEVDAGSGVPQAERPILIPAFSVGDFINEVVVIAEEVVQADNEEMQFDDGAIMVTTSNLSECPETKSSEKYVVTRVTEEGAQKRPSVIVRNPFVTSSSEQVN